MSLDRYQQTLGSITLRNWQLRPTAPAIFYEGRTITHREFSERAFRLANALRRLGVKRGHRVAVLAQNCPEYMEAYAAAELGGWTTVTINYRLAAPEIAYIMRDSAPQVLIYEAELGDRIHPDVRKQLRHALVIRGDGQGHSQDVNYEAALAQEEPTPPPAVVEPDDVAYLVYTSGTTGRPKGVMLTHRGQMRSALISAFEALVQPTDRLALAMPYYHVGAKNQWLSHSMFGCPIILHRAFRPDRFLASLGEYGATVTLLAPTMLKDLLDLGCDRASVPSLRKIFYSAAPMPETLLRRAVAAFGPIFGQIYGMTESGGPGCTLHAHQHILDGPPEVVRRLRSAGQPMTGCEVRILAPDGSFCPPGVMGEIAIRSEALMAGYWNNHAATLETIVNGWLRTGDLGEVDREGFIYVMDRAKDMIVSGGENIYSREVEEALLSHPNIADAAVVGAPDERWGETVMAFVVKRPGSELTADDVIGHCREKIAGYKRPRAVTFVEALPKLPNGKVEKFKLRAPLWEGRARAV
jgi:acyl-CoA synthetase (AMP-forming)/AMP-acid ligase II